MPSDRLLTSISRLVRSFPWYPALGRRWYYVANSWYLRHRVETSYFRSNFNRLTIRHYLKRSSYAFKRRRQQVQSNRVTMVEGILSGGEGRHVQSICIPSAKFHFHLARLRVPSIDIATVRKIPSIGCLPIRVSILRLGPARFAASRAARWDQRRCKRSNMVKRNIDRRSWFKEDRQQCVSTNKL